MCGCSTSYLWRWLLRALLFLAAVLPTSSDCPKSCACYVPTEVHCTFRYLTTVPDHIQPAVERINLGYNSITVLGENDLSGLENLELLMLHSNTIHSIQDRAFQDLKSLQVLKMSFNKVKKINKETFKGLESLLRLHMDHNQIEFISPDAFYGLTKLQLVHLEGNRLQQLHPDTFVTLRHSQVFRVSSVRNIHLSDNLLSTLPADIFSSCIELENVFLHGNLWACDCRMKWFSVWVQRNTGVLKCKRDRRYPRGQLCPVCESPSTHHTRDLSLLPSEAFACSKPWIQNHLKQKNITLDEGDFTPVSPKDFIAPLGTIQMNLTNQFHNDGSLSCSVQRPSAFENMTQISEEEHGINVTLLRVSITTYLVCNTDNDHIHQLWQILATYSDSPLRLQRGLMLARSPDMVYRYSQVKAQEHEDGIYTNTEAEIKASPAWLMQGEVSFQLDRTATTFSTLHIKYQSVVNLRVDNTSPKRDRYSWTMIKRDNQTKTEYTAVTGGVVQLNCEIQGEPKPLLEWILPDGSKVRAPYSSEDRRIIITAEGKLTVRGVDASDTGIYRCITTNYLDADILIFRVTVLSPDVEEVDINGLQISRSLDQNLVFDCSSSGSPKATTHWILPDHSVLDKSHGNKKVNKNGTLLIQGLTERDRGFYRCLVGNQLGVDLLVSQVTLTEEKMDSILDSEGSGMELGDKTEPSMTENTVTQSETPSSRYSDRNSQESRTITSDRPYPRGRAGGRGGAGGRLGQRSRGTSIKRRMWSSRGLNKASRKVDPRTFAEFMKKAQHGSRKMIGTEENRAKYADSNTVLSGDSEIGSGEDHEEDQLIIVQETVKVNIDQVHITGQFSNIETSTGHQTVVTVAHTDKMRTTDSYMQSDSPQSESTFTKNPKDSNGGQSDAVTQYNAISQNSLSNFDKTSDLNALESGKLGSDSQAINLQLTVTDSSQETQLHFSGVQPAEPETSTWAAISFTTDPNVTPMRDGPGPVELVVHTSTDPDSQTTFTAVTTAERQQDEITFHTTQTIKSPRLPAGSTIISRQQIHIIPNKNSRGGARRRIFQGRRRIIKPSRITDMQSFISKLKKSSVYKDGNATVPYKIELTTECECDEENAKTTTALAGTERPAPTQGTVVPTTNYFITSTSPLPHTEMRPLVSSGYMTSADAPEIDPTTDAFSELPLSTTVTTTTTASKVIRGRIPWNRLFGGRERGKILGRLKRPFVIQKTTTIPAPTTETTTVTLTTTPALPTTTAVSLAEPETLAPSIHTGNEDGSVDGEYEDLTSSDFELTTVGPTFHQPTTTNSSPQSKPFTTTETLQESQTLPSPPTVKPPSIKHPDEAISSGSGGLPDSWFIKQKPGVTNRQPGRRRRPFRGRRPFNKPAVSKLHPSNANKALSTDGTTIKTTMETSTLPQEVISLYQPLYTPYWRKDLDIHKFDQSTSRGSQAYTTTKIPTTFTPTTALKPATTNTPFTTAQSVVHSNNNHSPPIRRIGPIVEDRGSRHSSDNTLTFDTMTILTAEQGYTNTSASHHDISTANGISILYNHATSNEVTSTSLADFESTTNVMKSKPKIVGGNAASFTVLSNSDAFLPCEAMGNPQPTVTWKRFSTSTGNTITIKGRMGKFEVLSNGTLSIQNANIKDRGQYLCLAENYHGSDKLLVTLSVVAYPSRILEPKMREMKSHAGNTVEMTCKAEGRPTPTISWILANRTQVRGFSAEKGRTSVSAVGTLVIEKVTVYDRGHYKCIASNPAGADTITVRLQVVAAPPGIMEEKRQQMKANVNQMLWLPCTGHGNPQPTIHWVLHDGSMVQSNRHTGSTRVIMHENGTLHIKDVREADSGKYECIATSSTGSERRVVTLTVQNHEVAPQILETSQRMTQLFYGDQLRLNCSAAGNPKPRIMWRLPSKAVVDQWHRMGSRIKVLNNGTLIVSTVSDKDTGDYVCVARSKIGDDFQLMKVSVSMKPAKIEAKINGKKQVLYGNDVKVDCKASGAPKPEISWGLPDGTVVNSALQSDASRGGGRARRYTLFDNGTLYLNQVGISEEGDYTCYAENQMGKDEMIVHISVMTSAPRIRPSSQDYKRVKPGGNIRFDCETIGEPKPKILWILPNNDVIAASNERYLMHVNGSLDIRNVKAVDAGEYICMARNPAGENRKVYKLDIDGNPPVINGYQQNRTVIKDVATKFSRKLIDCKAEGSPSPSITWIMPDNIFLTAPYFGGRINVHQNGTLEIRNVRPTDTAEFICMARNDGGEAVMVVQLEVTSMLQRPIFKNPFNERIVSRTGKTTVLNCTADGHPLPEIIWTLPNGTRFTSGPDRGSRHHLGRDGTLVIYNPRKEDAGKYRCGAKNSVGYIEKLIVLDVGQSPYILTRPRGIIRSVSGEPLFLHCLSDGSPSPRIYWTLPGGHTLIRPQVFGRYQLLENGTLVIGDTTVHDRGNYICKARNDAGEAVLNVPVVIIAYRPRITTGPPQSVKALTGTPFQLSCVASGIPKPEITWELPDHSILSTAEQGRPMGSELLHPQGTLIIQRPTSADSGTYKCLAKNHLGTDSKSTYVHVV